MANNAWVANPIWRLVQAMSTFVDKDENILVKDFFQGLSLYRLKSLTS